MKLQLIRNATMKLEYSGKTLLTDPMLSEKGAFMPFALKARNPTVNLNMPAAEVIKDVEALIVSHTHPDHLDAQAVKELPKHLPLFCQPGEETKIAGKGFSSVQPVASSVAWEGISLARTEGRHGLGWIQAITGKVSGFVFQAEGEPATYWVGDSVWCDEVRQAIEVFQPAVIITHSGGARFPGMRPIIMDAPQTIQVAKTAPEATIVAVHMESLDHCGVTRSMLRMEAKKSGVDASRLLIPADGETIIL